MRFGLLPSYRTPAVATPAYAVEIARIAEDGGCDSIWTVEHVVIPSDYESRYPYAEGGRMPLTAATAVPDPLDWLAFVAATTTTLKLATGMIILPEHNPLQLAKRLATIDALSNGRLMIGIGVGWLREEAEALGTPFEERGARADEWIRVMRALWTGEPVSFEGRFVRFTDMASVPRPVQPGGVPIVVGGHSPAASRRAGRLGDGFYPLGVGPDELAGLLDVMRTAAQDAGRDADAIEITASGTNDLDRAKRLVDLGVSRFTISARGDDLEGTRRLVGEFAEQVVAKLP